jgi:glycosyltransferase involved in cell wall biosynthesis
MNTAEEKLEFEHELLPSLELPMRARPAFAPLSLERPLADLKPTLLVSAGFSPFVSGRVAAVARRRNVTFGLWSGEHAAMATARSRLRRAQRRRLVASADFAIAYGQAAGDYLRSLRPDIPLIYGRNTSVSATAPPSARARQPVEVLAVGDLASPRKGIDILLQVLRLSPDLPVRLTVIGGGKLLTELALTAAKDERIRLLGSLPPTSVRVEYSKADVFAFPSRSDVFGLALVEAMAFGLATLTSGSPGAVADLCVHEHNCLLTQSHEPSVWRERLAELTDDHDLGRTLGLRAHQTVARRWTLDHAADAMLAGLRLGILVRRKGGRAR